MSSSNRVHWESLSRETYEDMVAVLISRLHPDAQRIDGSGGDGGRDVQIPADYGLVIYQLKSLTGRMDRSRRRQVKDSLVAASLHSPAEWFLVVPIDPTPGEKEWFDRLVEPYGFECRWLGKTWLDSEMAQKPEIGRYYAHGERYEISEFLELLGGVNPEPLPDGAGVLGTAARNAQDIVNHLNQLDPHFVFDIATTADGGPHVSVIPRYPGAEKDRPPFSVALAFPDTEEGASAQQALQATFDYGTASVVAPEFISKVVVNVPAGLGAVLEGYEMALGGPTPGLADDVRVALKAIGSAGAVEAQLPLVAEEASAGGRGVLISLADKSEAVTAEIKIDVSELTISLNWAYSQPDVYSPLDLLPAARFAAALEGGAKLAFDFNGETHGPCDIGPFPSDVHGEAARYADFLGHLANLQIKAGVFFDVRDEFPSEEVTAIVQASRLLNGETIEGTWQELSMIVKPDGRDTMKAALGTSPVVGDVQSGGDMSIVVQGNEIPVGLVRDTLAPARVLSWEEVDDGDMPGATKLILVPADSNKVTRTLETAGA